MAHLPTTTGPRKAVPVQLGASHTWSVCARMNAGMSAIQLHAPTSLLNRARHIHRAEGLLSLFRHAAVFLRSAVFAHEVYYLTEHNLTDFVFNESTAAPKTTGFRFEMVSSNDEADKLEAEGLEFRSCALNSRERLNEGAIAFCIFVGEELAHVAWVATTRRAKDSLPDPPYSVDFSNNEACTGDIWTNPEFRRYGFRTYRALRMREFLVRRGIVVARSAIAKRNVPSLGALPRIGSTIHAEGRWLRVLWWKWWWEKPLSQPPAATGAQKEL